MHADFRLVPKLMTLNDLGPPNGRYFALLHRMRELSKTTASNWLKPDPYYQQGRSQDFTLGAQKLSAEGARIEAPKAPRGLGLGRGVPLPQPTRGS